LNDFKKKTIKGIIIIPSVTGINHIPSPSELSRGKSTDTKIIIKKIKGIENFKNLNSLVALVYCIKAFSFVISTG
jgi:hypothetical protein